MSFNIAWQILDWEVSAFWIVEPCRLYSTTMVLNIQSFKPFRIVKISGFGQHLIQIEPWFQFSFDTSL